MSKNGKKKQTKESRKVSELYADLSVAQHNHVNQAVEIKSLNKCNDYLHERLKEANGNVETLGKANQDAARLRQAMYRGFAQERDEKYAEIYRLENRMRALGYELPDNRKAGV